MGSTLHEPVLAREAIQFLRCRPGSRLVDCTTGGGGHAERILESIGADGSLLALDRDPEALALARGRIGHKSNRICWQVGDFRQLPVFLAELGWQKVDGILVDLGLSSMQIEDPSRGFSFLREGPLDMRFDRRSGITAEEILNDFKEADLRSILRSYGEEPAAARIVRRIVRERKRNRIRTTRQLAGILESVAGPIPRRIHPATRTFQALRIAVNRELDDLDRFLTDAAHHLSDGGRIVVIAFHSLEDRIVKHSFIAMVPHCVCPPRLPQCLCDHPGILNLLVKRPVRPAPEEVANNPRARSARLRAAERIPAPENRKPPASAV